MQRRSFLGGVFGGLAGLLGLRSVPAVGREPVPSPSQCLTDVRSASFDWFVSRSSIVGRYSNVVLPKEAEFDPLLRGWRIPAGAEVIYFSEVPHA